MKHTFLLLLLAAMLTSLQAAGVRQTSPATEIVVTLTKESLEAELGRKLNFKERLAVKAFASANKKAQKQATKAALNPDRQTESGSSNGMAIAGFVCGVLSLLVGGVILGPLGIIFGLLGMRNSKRDGKPLKGLALAGFICGIVGTVGALIIIAALA